MSRSISRLRHIDSAPLRSAISSWFICSVQLSHRWPVVVWTSMAIELASPSAWSSERRGALLTLAAPLSLIVVGLALVGSGVFIAQATASSYIGVVTAEDRGLAVGLYSSAYYIGGSLGGALPSLFWETGGWTLCVLLVLAVQAATLATAFSAWRPSPRKPL